MKRGIANNTFENGLLQDVNPLVTPNNVVTNCLNGTLVTLNGNENTLQNDMGNGRVETAQLPEGYVPLGTTELGGIIYIVSYNPLTKKCQIGSFPSPERNITTDEQGKSDANINCSKFYETNTNNVIVNTLKETLTDNELHAGDKFCIYFKGTLENFDKETILSAYESKIQDINDLPKYLKLHIVSIQDDGKIIYLDDKLTWYDNNYYIKETNGQFDSQIDEYNNLINSNYSVFNSKIAGKLAILAELEAISTFSTSIKYKIQDSDDGTKEVILSFPTNWTYENKNLKSRSEVNPIGIHVITEDNEKNSIDLILNIPNKRNNDGTDEECIAEYLKFTYTPNEKKVLNFTISPQMKYGYLKYLENQISVDLSKLGSGITDLTEYRYYVEDQLFTLSYGFDSYPEEGKEVKSVTFNFYKFTNDIYNSIKNSENKIDTNYIYRKLDNSNFYWSDKTTSNFKITEKPVDYEIINTSNSILGRFDERIFFDNEEKTGLKPNQCYLTKITINYNDEEERVYYRLLYTSTLFNSKYYENNDFKDIILSECLQSIYETSDFETNTFQQSRQIFKGTEIISRIPGVVNESCTNIYNVKDTFTNQIQYNVSSYANFSPSLFKFEIQNILKSSTQSESNNDAKQTYIIEGDDTLKISISSNINNNLINFNKDQINIQYQLENNIDTPIKVVYDKTDIIPVQYELQPLKMSIYYLSANGNARNLRIGIDDTWQHPEQGIASSSTGDDHTKTFSNITNMPGVGPTIQELLKERDYIALCCNYYYNKHDRCQLVYEQDRNPAKGYKGSGEKEAKTLKACFVIFAFKTDTSINCLAFPEAVYGEEYKNDVSGDIKMSTLESINFSEDIKNQFSNCYKLEEYSGQGKSAYSSSNVVYWNNFNSINKVITKLKLEEKLQINDINIDGNLPKNLIYNKLSNEKEFTFTINNRIDLNSILYYILNTTSNVYYIAKDTNDFIQVDIIPSNKKVYEVIDTNIQEANIGVGLSLNYEGNQIILKNDTSNDSKATLAWRSEEQGQRIQNITLIK